MCIRKADKKTTAFVCFSFHNTPTIDLYFNRFSPQINSAIFYPFYLRKAPYSILGVMLFNFEHYLTKLSPIG
jgi:hypothetical protein